MKNIFILLFASFVVLSGASLVSAASYTTGDNPTISTAVNDDAFVSGGTVSIDAPVMGELFAAGDKVTVSEKPSRSIFVAGNTVTVSEGSSYNVFAAGNDVTIKGDIAHDVFVAGNRITIDPSTTINGTLHIAGNEMKIAGTIKGNVEANGNMVTINAVIGGNFKGDVTNLTFTGGSIGGNLDYKSAKDADGLSTVTITGSTTRGEQSYTPSSPLHNWLWAGLGTLITGLAILFMMPRKLEDEINTMTTQWPKALGWGLVTLIVTPIVGALLLATMIGAPIGVILLIAYIIALYLAGVIGQMFIGSWILKRAKTRITTQKQHLGWSLVVGIIVVGLLKMIPVVGGIIAFIFFIIAFLPAFGAAALWVSNFLKEQQSAK